jgi:predicted Zn-ribbon and HTH transcriptional regulator
MSRPTFEVADIIQAQGARYVDSHRDQISYQQLKVLNAIARCRTAALGGHIDDCPRCGHKAISYNSCRNRHCPKCQAQARQRWLAAREKELLGVPLCVLPRYVAFDLRSRDVGGHFCKNTT